MPFEPPDIVDLPNGEAVCADHQLTVCGICCLDLTDLGLGTSPEDTPKSRTSDDKTEAGAKADSKVPTGRVIPKKFKPPNSSDTPVSLFRPAIDINIPPRISRFVRRTNRKELMIYTDGACLGNGQANPTAGCAFIYGDTRNHPGISGYASFGLEDKGPTGQHSPQTSNRAELRAVIAALRFRYWTGEGWQSMVIATDSSYVVEGITTWVNGWLKNEWNTRQGKRVMNKDLWECLLDEIKRLDECGMKVRFWKIPRELNQDADRYAKESALKVKKEKEEAALNGRQLKPTKFRDVVGLLV